jgi:hypothetical protein
MLPILLTLIPGMIGYNVRDELGSWVGRGTRAEDQQTRIRMFKKYKLVIR